MDGAVRISTYRRIYLFFYWRACLKPQMGKLYEHTQTRTHPSLLTSKAATECPKYAAIYKMRAKESRGDGIMSLHKKTRSHKHFGQIGNL